MLFFTLVFENIFMHNGVEILVFPSPTIHWINAREVFWAYRVGQDPSDSKSSQLHAMIGENRQLVTNEPVEFEK